MPPPRSLPLQFLLPAWSPRQLHQVLQRAHSSNSTRPAPKKTKNNWYKRLELDSRERELTFEEANPQLSDLFLPSTSENNASASSKPLLDELFPDGLNPKGDSTASKSLFEELFPDGGVYKEPKKQIKEPKKLEPFQWNAGLELKYTKNPAFSQRKQDAYSILKEQLQLQPRRAKPSVRAQATPDEKERNEQTRQRAIVLKLNLASKILEESDFFRVAVDGKHIEGWTGGIIKVIQGRDANTLEPQGHYFILFSDEEAAISYFYQTRRLHKLSRITAGSLQATTLPPPKELVRPGEEVPELLESFSLIPGQVHLALDRVKTPYSPAMVKMLSAGGHHFLTRLQGNGEGTVLFTVDVGLIDYDELKGAIIEDGLRRNLRWRLVEEEGIVPLHGPESVGNEVEELEGRTVERGNYRRPARYILSFEDQQEARRFVRDWHRRPFKRTETSRHHRSDDRDPIINAQFMW